MWKLFLMLPRMLHGVGRREKPQGNVTLEDFEGRLSGSFASKDSHEGCWDLSRKAHKTQFCGHISHDVTSR